MKYVRKVSPEEFLYLVISKKVADLTSLPFRFFLESEEKSYKNSSNTVYCETGVFTSISPSEGYAILVSKWTYNDSIRTDIDEVSYDGRRIYSKESSSLPQSGMSLLLTKVVSDNGKWVSANEKKHFYALPAWCDQEHKIFDIIVKSTLFDSHLVFVHIDKLPAQRTVTVTNQDFDQIINILDS